MVYISGNSEAYCSTKRDIIYVLHRFQMFEKNSVLKSQYFFFQFFFSNLFAINKLYPVFIA